jgi:hypothetical protein
MPTIGSLWRKRRNEKDVSLAKHVHYFKKSLSNSSCATLTMIHRVYTILETMYFIPQICAAGNCILMW